MGWVKADGVIYHANIDPFSATAHFNVDPTTTSPSPSPSPQETKPEPFQSTWITAAATIIATGGTAVLVYFAKVKKTTGKVEK
jgi:hypothetical protein